MSLGEAVEKQEKVSGKWKKFLFFIATDNYDESQLTNMVMNA